MTNVFLLKTLAVYTEEKIKDLLLPVKMQPGDTVPKYRAANVFKMRLPDKSPDNKYAPYIIHQVIETDDEEKPGDRATANTLVRTVFCVYNDNAEEGSMVLLSLMERLRSGFLKDRIIGNQFYLDLTQQMKSAVYPDDLYPYYIGEMLTAWIMPPITREVNI